MEDFNFPAWAVTVDEEVEGRRLMEGRPIPRPAIDDTPEERALPLIHSYGMKRSLASLPSQRGVKVAPNEGGYSDSPRQMVFRHLLKERLDARFPPEERTAGAFPTAGVSETWGRLDSVPGYSGIPAGASPQAEYSMPTAFDSAFPAFDPAATQEAKASFFVNASDQAFAEGLSRLLFGQFCPASFAIYAKSSGFPLATNELPVKLGMAHMAFEALPAISKEKLDPVSFWFRFGLMHVSIPIYRLQPDLPGKVRNVVNYAGEPAEMKKSLGTHELPHKGKLVTVTPSAMRSREAYNFSFITNCIIAPPARMSESAMKKKYWPSLHLADGMEDCRTITPKYTLPYKGDRPRTIEEIVKERIRFDNLVIYDDKNFDKYNKPFIIRAALSGLYQWLDRGIVDYIIFAHFGPVIAKQDDPNEKRRFRVSGDWKSTEPQLASGLLSGIQTVSMIGKFGGAFGTGILLQRLGLISTLDDMDRILQGEHPDITLVSLGDNNMLGFRNVADRDKFEAAILSNCHPYYATTDASTIAGLVPVRSSQGLSFHRNPHTFIYGAVLPESDMEGYRADGQFLRIQDYRSCLILDPLVEELNAAHEEVFDVGFYPMWEPYRVLTALGYNRATAKLIADPGRWRWDEQVQDADEEFAPQTLTMPEDQVMEYWEPYCDPKGRLAA